MSKAYNNMIRRRVERLEKAKADLEKSAKLFMVEVESASETHYGFGATPAEAREAVKAEWLKFFGKDKSRSGITPAYFEEHYGDQADHAVEVKAGKSFTRGYES